MRNNIETYLASCYAYYVLDEPFLEDQEHDAICQYILSNYDKFEKHPLIEYVSKDALKCNSYLGEYPITIDILYKIFKKG